MERRLEYLAYYQVIEFYLPTYTRSAAIARMRTMLKDPRFDYSDDAALGRILNAVTPAGRAPSEREQIAATVAECTDDSMIASYLTDRPRTAKALADRARIAGVRTINPKDQQTLTGQVADRIYDLRCRIVHGKDSAEHEVRAIRPFDRESRLLRPDLNLIRFVAQRALITSSRPASWR